MIEDLSYPREVPEDRLGQLDLRPMRAKSILGIWWRRGRAVYGGREDLVDWSEFTNQALDLPRVTRHVNDVDSEAVAEVHLRRP